MTDSQSRVLNHTRYLLLIGELLAPTGGEKWHHPSTANWDYFSFFPKLDVVILAG